MEQTTHRQMSESFRLGAVLALTGGFLDAYTYLIRGGVFANAQTGNIVLLGVRLMEGDWGGAGHYLVPILAFAAGVLAAELIRGRFRGAQALHWRQITVAAELLKNLFWNKAPLHDGAVIVRNGHIVGAGCVLPLSGNVNLSRDLGMRHRAGIGMSENSDAVVAIVSEETGSISVAVNGMLKRHLAPETLERLLRNELLPQEESSSKSSILTSLFKSKKGDKDDGEEVHGK